MINVPGPYVKFSSVGFYFVCFKNHIPLAVEVGILFWVFM